MESNQNTENEYFAEESEKTTVDSDRDEQEIKEDTEIETNESSIDNKTRKFSILYKHTFISTPKNTFWKIIDYDKIYLQGFDNCFRFS